MQSFEDRLRAVGAAGGDAEARTRLYDAWAESYDADLWASGNPAAAMTAAMVGRSVPDFDAELLDAGCGAGMTGQILYQLGYRRIDGLDVSAGMLAMAKRKACYRRLLQARLDASLEIADGRYDAVIAADVLNDDHAPANALDALLRLARADAPIIFSMSDAAHDQGGLGERMRKLEGAGAWRLVEQSTAVRSFPFMDALAHLRHWVCVYRKTF